MGQAHSSAGVYSQENDYSQQAQGASTSIAVMLGEALRGPVNQPVLITSEAAYISTFGKPNAAIGFLGYSALAFLNQGNQLYVTRVAPNCLYGGCMISYDGHFNVSSSFAAGIDSPDAITFTAGSLFAVYAVNQGVWSEELFIRVYPDTRAVGYFWFEVYVAGASQPAERFRCHLNLIVDGFGTQLNVEQQINSSSKYVRVLQNHDQADFVSNPNKALVNTFDAGGDATKLGIQLVGGADGTRATTSDFINALSLYADREVISINMLVNAGIYDPDYQRALDEMAKDRADCMAILDMPRNKQGVQDAIAYRRSELMLDTSYSAIYSPDVYVADKYNDIRLYCPPSGFVAAAYAFTDNNYDVWFAPAGMVRGDLSVDGLRTVYNQGDRDALYDSQVNAIRLTTSGIKIWGADTLQIIPSALSNVSVRRMMMYIEVALDEVALYSVFDPNNQTLRSRLAGAADRFLKPIKDGRGLYSYEVVCDDSNNPASTIAAGDLIMDIWVDPTLPAKRVKFTAIINRTGARVTGVPA
jgi:phage tail sheath protein FI